MTNLDHFDRLFLLVAVGAGLVLVAGVNLVAGTRTRRRAVLGAVAGVAVCGAVVATLSALTRGELGARAAVLLGGAGVAVTFASALLRSAWFRRRAATAAVALWAFLAVGGVALAAFAVVGFERSDLAFADQEAANFTSALGHQPHQPAARARAVTDRGAAIVLKEPIALRDGTALAGPEERFLRTSNLADQVIRQSAATDLTNCHGWVFTGGKFILSPDDVEAILKDNGYTQTQDPQPGDLVIYRQGGSIAHSAVVRYVTEGQPVLIEGKWGTLGVFLHSADKSVYGTDYTFHRSGRRGHLLVGLGGVSPDPTVVAPAVTE